MRMQGRPGDFSRMVKHKQSPDLFTTARRFLGAVVVSFALVPSAVAQLSQGQKPLPQTDEFGSGVISNTVEHTRPTVRTPFRNTPPSLEGDDQSSNAVPSGLQPQNASDDFDNSAPTGWWVYTGQNATEIANTIEKDNARIIDIAVDSFSPSYTFTVTYVANTGAYAKGWWWYYGQTAAQVSALCAANNARAISLKAYDIGGGQIRFAVVMIANTGSDAREWWWYYGESVSALSGLLNGNNARLIAVDPYVTGGNTEYSAIMISNTGIDAAEWWWYIDLSPSALASAITANKARIFYLTENSNGTLNAIMESCSSGCSEWWYYYGLPASQLLKTANQNGARLVNVATSPGCGGLCYTGAMINNSNAITSRVGNLIRNGGIGGTQGLYLKKVGGPALANLEDNVVFEPASAIKVVANLYAMTQVQKGSDSLTTPITHYTNGPESCPNPPVVSGTEPLGLALREMMWHSDNTRTREVTDYFGDANINAYAKSIGMPNTSINHYIGCGGPVPDTLTLDDAGHLYEGVAQQTLLSAKDRGIFYSNMAGRAQYESEGYDWTGVWSTDIPNIINQVAPTGYTAAQKTAYFNAMDVAYKAGNYVHCTNSNCTDVVEDIAIAGWFQLPVCSATGTTYAEYVYGIYFSNVPTDGWSSGEVTPADNDFTTAKSELMREQIQAGMQSCLGKSLDVLTWSPSDLVFAATTVGKESAAKTITLTNHQLTNATSLGISVFGDFSESNNCGSSIAAGKSCTVTVLFKPTTKGERTGAVIVTDTGTGQPQTIQLTGTGQ